MTLNLYYLSGLCLSLDQYTLWPTIIRWFYRIIMKIPNRNIHYIFVKTSFSFDYGFKNLTTSLETNNGLTLVLEIIHSTISCLNHYFVVLYLEQPLISFSVTFSIMDIFTPILFSLIAKLSADLQSSIVSFIKCFIVGLNVLI